MSKLSSGCCKVTALQFLFCLALFCHNQILSPIRLKYFRFTSGVQCIIKFDLTEPVIGGIKERPPFTIVKSHEFLSLTRLSS
jgi:hypothetical protein